MNENVETAVIEVEDVPHDPTWAVTQAGTAALASMSEADFEERLLALAAGRDRVRRIQRTLMEPNEDYGLIPGTQKPTLLKPGAEKLCDFYRLAVDFEPTVTYGDGTTEPPISVVMRCQLHLGSLDGPVVGVGYGQANSWEKRYRYRKGERTCLACGKPGKIVHTRRNSWWHPQDKGGCGQSVEDSDPRVAAWLAQDTGDVENPDPYELANTLVKMAEKRAHIDATLRTTATSGLFTQDMDEQGERPEVDPTTGEVLSKPVAERQTLRKLAEAAADAAETPQEAPQGDDEAGVAPDTGTLFGDAPEPLSDAEFRALCKAAGTTRQTVASTAKRLYPAEVAAGAGSADLTDAQRGRLWVVLATEAE